MAKDILLTVDNDLMILNGDFFVGESEMQEVGIILQMNQGELKSNPLIGGNLIPSIRGIRNDAKVKRHIEMQMELDGKNFETIKDKLTLK